MSEELIVNALQQLSKTTFRNNTARLREIYDEVKALKCRGFSHKIIVETLNEQGLAFDLRTFEVTLYRLKKEHAKNQKGEIGQNLMCSNFEVVSTNAILEEDKFKKTETTDGLSKIQIELLQRPKTYPKRTKI